tara:strand:- start:7382 stop:8689 length:1308 start_codon:yes stop_codon:yes gene_type:complete
MKEETLQFLKNDEKLVNLITSLNFNQLSFIDKIKIENIDCTKSLSKLLIIEVKKEISNKNKIEKILKKNKKETISKALDFILNKKVISIMELLNKVVTQSEFIKLFSLEERKNILTSSINKTTKIAIREYADFAFSEIESKNIQLTLDQIISLDNYSYLSFNASEKGSSSFYNITYNSIISLKTKVDPKSKTWAMLLFSNPNFFTKKEKTDFIKNMINALRGIKSSINSKERMKAALKELQIYTYDEIYSTFFNSRTDDLKSEEDINESFLKITIKILSLKWVKEILKNIEPGFEEFNCPFSIINMGYLSHKEEEILELKKMMSNLFNLVDNNSTYSVLESRFTRREAFNIVYENRNINEVMKEIKEKRRFSNDNSETISFLSYYKDSLQLKILNDFDLNSNKILDVLKEIHLKLNEDFEIEDFDYELVVLNHKD